MTLESKFDANAFTFLTSLELTDTTLMHYGVQDKDKSICYLGSTIMTPVIAYTSAKTSTNNPFFSI